MGHHSKLSFLVEMSHMICTKRYPSTFIMWSGTLNKHLAHLVIKGNHCL